jgi:hypothetical protein
MRAVDTGDAWTITDGSTPGTITASRGTTASGGTTGAPALEATASDLILWLYSRTDLDSGAVPPDLLTRFRDG